MRVLFLALGQLFATMALAPFVTGLVRTIKSRMCGRQGPSLWQPYRDIRRLLQKDVVLAHNASWLFRIAPYLIFTAIWLGAIIVPTFTTGLISAPTADLIALVALLGTARFILALAGMDTGTSFGGLGSSREMMIATLAEPAMLMITFMIALLVRSTSLPNIARYFLTHDISLHISLFLALISLLIVAIAENARVPVDNPATHLELTMVHEAMILEYSGRHLAMIEMAAMMKLLLYISLIACIFLPWGLALDTADDTALIVGFGCFIIKLLVGATALAFFEVSIAKMRVFRVPEFLGTSMLLGLLGVVFLYVTQGL